MKQLISLFLLGVTVFLTGCNASQVGGITQATEKVFTETDNQVESEKVLKQSQFFLTETSDELQTEQEEANMVRFIVGKHIFLAKLEDNASAKELKELLKNGKVTMSASSYGGFEKVCSLGTRLTSDDAQTTTQTGDVMLYSSDQIVIFYGSNSWAYTRLAKVVDEDIPSLQDILSGSENKVMIELA